MKTILACSAVCLPLMGLAAFSPSSSRPELQDPVTASATGEYQVDPVHSTAMFRIKHLNASFFYGRFNLVEGSFTWDEKDLSKTKVKIEVSVDSVDTHDTKRDNHLKSPDFFNARLHPKLTFTSSKIEGTASELKVTGILSLHGVEKEITVSARFTGYSETRMGKRAGFETTFSVERADFGITTYPDMLGATVDITLSIEAVKS